MTSAWMSEPHPSPGPLLPYFEPHSIKDAPLEIKIKALKQMSNMYVIPLDTRLHFCHSRCQATPTVWVGHLCQSGLESGRDNMNVCTHYKLMADRWKEATRGGLHTPPGQEWKAAEESSTEGTGYTKLYQTD